MSVSYCVNGRFANNLIQYFAAKVLCKLTGKEYVYNLKTHSHALGDHAFIQVYNNLKNNNWSIEGNILLNSFYQSKEWIFPEVDFLKTLITIDNQDRINDSYRICDIAQALNNFKMELTDDDLIIHIRLDDFFHQGANSDVIDPYSLIELVNSLKFKNNILICDKLRFDWEHNYINLLLENIPNSKLLNNDLLTDFSIMYYAKNIVVSRSTFSWISSILSPHVTNSWFPLRNFICMIQTIDRINDKTIHYRPNYLKTKL